MREITYSEALREAMQEEMRKDSNVILIGEDVGEGYKGCFGVSTGLFEEFGKNQIIDTPISENCIMGAGVGTALLGMKPIVEMMFSDFISVCFDGVFNQAAKVRFMSGDQYNLNMVIRLPGGSGGGTGPHHSQCMESIFLSIPGLQIANPSNAYDAKGLLKTAISSGDPVLFFEHKKLYKQKYIVPEEEYTLPFGEGRIVREGKDLTIIAISYMVTIAMEVAKELNDEKGLDIEIIDPRTIVPLDTGIIIESVKKTSRLITLEEGAQRGGIGSEILAIINEKCFDYLDSPMKRIASKNTPIPMSGPLEEQIIPNKNSIKKEILKYLG